MAVQGRSPGGEVTGPAGASGSELERGMGPSEVL